MVFGSSMFVTFFWNVLHPYVRRLFSACLKAMSQVNTPARNFAIFFPFFPPAIVVYKTFFISSFFLRVSFLFFFPPKRSRSTPRPVADDRGLYNAASDVNCNWGFSKKKEAGNRSSERSWAA